MQTITVPGKHNEHKVLMYALSTCGWCKRAKKFLENNNVEYEYFDVDLASEEDKQKVRQNRKARRKNRYVFSKNG